MEQMNNILPEELISNNSKSTGFIMKLTMLIVMIMVVVFLARIGIALILMFKNPIESPYILDGMISGAEKLTVTQNPNISDSITIFRSVNQSSGMEFTWSTWLFVEQGNFDGDSASSRWRHIFHKGPDLNDPTTDPATGSTDATERVGMGHFSGIKFPLNSPGLYLSKTKNDLKFIMSTLDWSSSTSNNGFESIDISNIPLEKWFCLVIRGKNNILDAYVNGIIHARQYVEGVMKQTYYDLHFGLNNGWDGYISSLKYHNKGLSVVEIQNIYNKGPNLKLLSKIKSTETDYISNLSQKWYGY
jgi:hypothetical protein